MSGDSVALVLGGGGAKGSYEIGVFDALEQLSVRADAVYGTSVGALNGAMYAQHALPEAERLWERLRLTDLVAKESVRMADAAEKVFDHPEKLLDFLARSGRHLAADIGPYEELLRGAVDEAALRSGGVRFGLTATRVNGLALVEKRLEDIPEGQVVDWLLASSACFPVFPLRQIGTERYADGGFCDNVPVAMALKGGWRHVIAVDIGRHRSHSGYDLRPNVTYIRTVHPLGGMMAFDPENAARLRRLGRLDTLRAFGCARGFAYAFDSEEAGQARGRAEDYVRMLSRLEAGLASSRAIRFGRRERTPFFALLESGMDGRRSELDYFLRGCELLCGLVGLAPDRMLTLRALSAVLSSELPLARAAELADSLSGGHPAALLSGPQPDRKLAVSCLYGLLRRRGMDFPLAVYAAGAFPREFVCAVTLLYLLPA